MTKTSIMELAETVRKRYHDATKKEKTKILDEFCTNTGYHRKAAIRLINRIEKKRKRVGPKVKYHPVCTEILKEIWRVMDYICPDRFYDEIPGILGKIGDALLAVSLLRVEVGKREIFAAIRSRPSRKNDNCHVEERNNERVRKHVGYKRYTKRHLNVLNRLYEKLDNYSNFFIPSMKLEKKVYNDNHKLVKRVYGKTKTPYQRVLNCDEVDLKVKMRLMQKYHKLDILQLREEIDLLLRELNRT